MSRLMSVAYTEQAVRERRKTVTRRAGWWLDRRGRRLVVPGDQLTLVRKAMGRKPGEPLVRLAQVEVVDVRREPLCAVAGPHTLDDQGTPTWPEMAAEGFPDMDPHEFMRRYFTDAQGIRPMDEVTRIEWRYLTPHPMRPYTPTARLGPGRSRITVQRCCNGCGNELGDATLIELDACVVGTAMPDARAECVVCSLTLHDHDCSQHSCWRADHPLGCCDEPKTTDPTEGEQQ